MEGVHIFDKSRQTCLATDWSKDGIVFWLFQKLCVCTINPLCCNTCWKTTLVGSSFIHPAEPHYTPIEGGALAVADALDKARDFVLGCDNLIIVANRKPLIKQFGYGLLGDISNRFKMIYVPGIRNKVSGTMSRHPTGHTHPLKIHLQDDIYVIMQSEQPLLYIKHVSVILNTIPT